MAYDFAKDVDAYLKFVKDTRGDAKSIGEYAEKLTKNPKATLTGDRRLVIVRLENTNSHLTVPYGERNIFRGTDKENTIHISDDLNKTPNKYREFYDFTTLELVTCDNVGSKPSVQLQAPVKGIGMSARERAAAMKAAKTKGGKKTRRSGPSKYRAKSSHASDRKKKTRRIR